MEKNTHLQYARVNIIYKTLNRTTKIPMRTKKIMQDDEFLTNRMALSDFFVWLLT